MVEATKSNILSQSTDHKTQKLDHRKSSEQLYLSQKTYGSQTGKAETRAAGGGACIDDFEFFKQIGEGSFGMVYLALDKETNMTVAIK